MPPNSKKSAAVAKRPAPAKSAKKPSAKAKKLRRVKPTPEYAATIYDRLIAHYPDAHCALDFKSPFQLLIATILSPAAGGATTTKSSRCHDSAL